VRPSQGNIISFTLEQLRSSCTKSAIGCWLWNGKKTDNGYGKIHGHGKYHRVHRVAYELRCGPIPKGLVVRHTCDVRTCCNPEHLLIGTPAENSADMVSRGRSARGDFHGLSKLTYKQVRRIRHLYKPRCKANGGRALAKMFGVDPSTISYVVSGRSFGYME
jgi:hypothetical protein